VAIWPNGDGSVSTSSGSSSLDSRIPGDPTQDALWPGDTISDNLSLIPLKVAHRPRDISAIRQPNITTKQNSLNGEGRFTLHFPYFTPLYRVYNRQTTRHGISQDSLCQTGVPQRIKRVRD
jgi:hypothetical protein